MRAGGVTRAGRVLAATTILILGICGCELLHPPQRAGSRLAAPMGRAAVLVLILDPASAQDRADFRSLVVATARAGEHLIVISAADDATLGSFTAPAAPVMTGPVFPELPPAATSFQQATYRRNLARARAARRHDLDMLRNLQLGGLRAWANGAVAAALSAAARHTARPGGLAQAVTEAVATVSALQQTGIVFGPRKVIAIIGAGHGQAPPQLPASLDGLTVVVTDVPDAAQDPAWQADLLQAGASRAFALTAATDGLLPGEVSSSLDGRAVIAFQLARIRYRPAQFELPPTAGPALREALRLLTVTYPGAIASINGYTDDVAVRGGNLALSWRRARAVLIWLIRHGVAAGRLQAIGHGSSDPVAPNQPGGQPLNRRLVIIISPGN